MFDAIDRKSATFFVFGCNNGRLEQKIEIVCNFVVNSGLTYVHQAKNLLVNPDGAVQVMAHSDHTTALMRTLVEWAGCTMRSTWAHNNPSCLPYKARNSPGTLKVVLEP